MPKSSERKQREDADGKAPKPGISVLARAAQVAGLAVVIFALAAISELISSTPIGFAEFRSGMGYAYLAAVSVLIAISSVAKTLTEDLRNAGILTAVGVTVMVTVTGDSSALALMSAVTGVFYVVVMRRIRPK